MRKFDTLENWMVFKQELMKKGYDLFQMQYDFSHDEGFHAWFIKGQYKVEVMTEKEDIQNDIIRYNR